MHQFLGKKKRLFLYISIFFFLTTINNKFDSTQKKPLFDINKYSVSGLSINDNKKIENKLNNLQNQNILFINRNSILKILSENNLIDSFIIKKYYPNLIKVELKKTNFIALTFINDDKYFIGSNGKLIKHHSISKKKIPIVYGKTNYKEFINLKKKIDNSTFNYDQIVSIIFFPSKRFDIKTDNGTIIKFPEKRILKALNLVDKIKNSDKLNKNKIIDLRIPGHIILSND